MLAHGTSVILLKTMRALLIQRIIVGGLALLVVSGGAFFVYSKNYEASFSRPSAPRSATNFSNTESWKEEISYFQKQDLKQNAASPSDPLKPKNPENLTEQLASVFSKKMLTDPQFDVRAFSGKEDVFGQEILKEINRDDLAKNPKLKKLALVLPSDEEISIVKDNSQKRLKEYFANVHSIVSRPYVLTYPELRSFSGVMNEAVIAEEAIKKNDFREIKKMSEFFTLKARELQALPVPSSAKEMHKKVTAFFRYHGDLYHALGQFSGDPFLGLTALQQLSVRDGALAELLQSIERVKKQAKL